MGISAILVPQIPQADWRIVSTAQRPDTLGALTQGVNLGSGLADLYRQNQFRQAAQETFDPATGEMNTEGLLRALMQYDPSSAIKFMQQKRLEDQQQAGMRYLLAQSGGDSEGPKLPGSTISQTGGGISPDAKRNIIGGALLSGDIGHGVMKLGELGQAAYLQDYNRQRELVDYGYTDQQGNWIPGKIERGALSQPGGRQQQSAPPAAGSPQSGISLDNLPDIGKYQDKPFFSDALGVARTYGIDPKIWMALITQESGWNPSARSPKGAMGLTQLMPGTAQRFGVTDPGNPQQALLGGAKYLRFLLDRYNGDYVKALAAYNAGEVTVDKYGGVPPYDETRNFVKSILADSRQQPTVMTDTGRQVYPRSGAVSMPIVGQSSTAMPLTMAGGPGTTTGAPTGFFQSGPIVLSPQQKAKQEVDIAIEKKRGELPIEQQGKDIEYRRVEEQRIFERANQLRDEYNKITTPFATQAQAYGDILNAARDLIKNPDLPAGESDINILYGYIKLLDPNSVVREGEVSMPAAARSVVDSIQVKLNRLNNGGALSASEREQIIKESYKRYDNAMNIADAVNQRYSKIAKSYNIPIDAAGIYDLRKSFKYPSSDDFLKSLQRPVESGNTGVQQQPTSTREQVEKQSVSRLSYVLRFPDGTIVTKEQADSWPKQVKDMMAERIRNNQVQVIRQ